MIVGECKYTAAKVGNDVFYKLILLSPGIWCFYFDGSLQGNGTRS